ncbi:uncharacterized protein DUF222 [Kribbella sp. VKM Ac-2571]|nr:uncharacterized protein DUF222 [Kribbella sp. VKM Ac-2571]
MAQLPGEQALAGAEAAWALVPPDDLPDPADPCPPRYLGEEDWYDDLPPMSRVDGLEWELWAGVEQDEAEREMLRLKAPAWVFLPPGAELAAALEELRPQCESPIALIEAMKAAARMEAWAAAIKTSAMASFHRQRKAQATEIPRPTQIDSSGRPIDPERSWAAEIGAALRLSTNTAARHIDTALHLTGTLTATHTALRCGALTWSKALAISEATRDLPDTAAQAVEAHVLRRAPGQTHANLNASLRRQVAKHTTQDAAERHRTAVAERTCKIVPLTDGMAGLWVVHTADKIQQMWVVIQAMADLTKRTTPTTKPGQASNETPPTQPAGEPSTAGTDTPPPHPSSTTTPQNTADTPSTPDTDAPASHHASTTAPQNTADTPGTPSAASTPGTASASGNASISGNGNSADNTAVADPQSDRRLVEFDDASPGARNSSATTDAAAGARTTKTNASASADAAGADAAGADAAGADAAGADAPGAGDVTGRVQSGAGFSGGSAEKESGQRTKDERNIEQRRADVVADVFEHMLHNGLDWLGRRLPDQHRRRPHIEILIPITTLLGVDNDPCELTGYGPIPAPMARRIARDGTWRRLLTDPTNGTILEASTTRHNPGTIVTETLLARHPVCAWPGCNRTSRQCDRDHATPFKQSGHTNLTGLAPYCEYHHVIKDTPGWGWKTTTHPDGSITLTTPTGHRYTTVPPARGPIVQNHNENHDENHDDQRPRIHPPTRLPSEDPPPF